MQRVVFGVALLVPAHAVAQPEYGTHREGLTFEANIGLGLIRASVDGRDSNTETAIGFGASIGGWLGPQIVLSGRVAGVLYTEPCSSVSTDSCTLNSMFFGPSVQYWANEQFWIGGGLGFATLRTFSNDSNQPGLEDNGLGLDLRGGYVFTPNNATTLSISLEYTPGFYEYDLGPLGTLDLTVHGFGILFGFQGF